MAYHPISTVDTTIYHHSLEVCRTAHVYTYGDRQTARIAILFCHGYGQLADRVLAKFDQMDPRQVYVVAPEGLSTFYWKGVTGDPAASWMTRRHRLDEIKDYSRYLDQVHEQYLDGIDARIIYMGFSQGCATIWRWMHHSSRSMATMINWAGWIPEDIDLSPVVRRSPDLDVHIVVGDQEQYLTPDRYEQLLENAARHGIPMSSHFFEGTHRIDRAKLREIVNMLLSENDNA